MSWEKYAYTSAGAAMLSESISGGALTITRAVSGTGTIDTDLSEETAVSGDTYELKLLGIDTVEYKGEKARKVSIWTGGADEPYFMIGASRSRPSVLLTMNSKLLCCWPFRPKPISRSSLTRRLKQLCGWCEKWC